jgi:hypothetical protein
MGDLPAAKGVVAETSVRHRCPKVGVTPRYSASLHLIVFERGGLKILRRTHKNSKGQVTPINLEVREWSGGAIKGGGAGG